MHVRIHAALIGATPAKKHLALPQHVAVRTAVPAVLYDSLVP